MIPVVAASRRASTTWPYAGEQRYLKSDLRFLGAPLAEIRRTVKEVSRDAGLDRDGALRLVEELWGMAAALILELHAGTLRLEDLRLVERLIRESRTWALVDVLSGDVGGEMVLRLRLRRSLDRWARDRVEPARSERDHGVGDP